MLKNKYLVVFKKIFLKLDNLKINLATLINVKNI